MSRSREELKILKNFLLLLLAFSEVCDPPLVVSSITHLRKGIFVKCMEIMLSFSSKTLGNLKSAGFLHIDGILIYVSESDNFFFRWFTLNQEAVAAVCVLLVLPIHGQIESELILKSKLCRIYSMDLLALRSMSMRHCV